MPPKPRKVRPKVSKPRNAKREAVREDRKLVVVKPGVLRGVLGWQVRYDDEWVVKNIGRQDAVSLGELIASLSAYETVTVLQVHGKSAKATPETRTFRRKDGPS